MKTIVIDNPRSGSWQPRESIRDLFKSHRVTIDHFASVAQLNTPKIRRCAKAGSRFIVIGGDGTLNRVAQQLVHTRSEMLPVAGGTFNHFVQDIALPFDLSEILARYNQIKTKDVDVGYVNDQLFLNNSNIGLYPMSLIERKQTKKYYGKWVAAALSFVDQLARFRRRSLRINGERIRTPFVMVGNNRYQQSGTLVPSRTTLDEGYLTLAVATSQSRVSLVKHAIQTLKNMKQRNSGIHISYVKKVTIESKKRQITVSYDGEVRRMKTPLMYRVDPLALTVCYLDVD